MTPVLFDYWFHAVGQGLFASGLIVDPKGGGRHFAWIFDCGTKSKKAFLEREINLAMEWRASDTLGLLCISHFDEDHINGVSKFLAESKVQTLVLPYLPLTTRMLIALTTPDRTEEYIRFLVDPVAYLIAAHGANIGEIVLIAGGGEDQGDDEGPETGGEQPPEDWNLQWPPTKRPDTPPHDPEIYQEGDSVGPGGGRAFVLGHEKPFRIGSFWEFKFYNEHKPSTSLERLRPRVIKAIRTHRKADGKFDGVALLKDLKGIYSLVLGKSSVAKNLISLVTYSGPVTRQSHPNMAFNGIVPSSSSVKRMNPGSHSGVQTEKPSVLYSGDYPLDRQIRLTQLRKHFGNKRWRKIGAFQVPHHGSEHSWFAGAGAQFNHDFSIFSASFESKSHPSKSVLDDLDTHGPILVNELQRFEYCGLANCD